MAKKLTSYRIITVWCKCGEKLIRYKKGPGRRLLKIHRDRITKDYCGIFINNYDPVGTDLYCPSCSGRVSTVQVVNGKYINKVNQGQIGIIKKN